MLFGEACTRCRGVCGLVLRRGQEVYGEERDRSQQPVLSPFPLSPAPQPSSAAGQDQMGCRAHRVAFLAPRLPLPGQLPRGTSPEARPLPQRSQTLRFPPAVSSFPPPPCRMEALCPAPSQPNPKVSRKPSLARPRSHQPDSRALTARRPWARPPPASRAP